MCGIPQGSVLGPCSSVSSSLTEIVRHPQYADDMKLSGAVAEGHDPIQDPGQI